ncbi:MAG: hypothetical protein RUDDFDWM_000646 [Candidatus Fervidibacterota bacterium]
MDERTLKLLEFDKIVEMLQLHARTTFGRELVASLKPFTNFEEVKRKLKDTSDVRRWLEKHGVPPIGSVRDVRAEIEKASSGIMLDTSELLKIASALSAAWEVKTQLERSNELPECLQRLSSQISDLRWLSESIRRAIDENGNVVDDASPRLRRIRASIRSTRDSLMRKLQSILSDKDIQAALQEPIVTVRNGRYCIPVKASRRQSVKGIVHDKSSSGLTLFVEPEEIVELGNQLRELQLDEEREVKHILRSLTDAFINSIEEVKITLNAIAHIDCLFSLAEFSLSLKCVEPEVSPDGATKLLGARHPLLGERAVPIDVAIGGDFDVLVITGPNMGGKTVTLKTIGLLTLMAQAGMHIPAKEGSRIRVFEKVFADIGEEQSIEQNISTFSSHILNIIKMLKHADERTLVLIDEIGAGTDPEEGAALAKAILLKFHEMGAKVVCTTHIGELKAFSYTHQRFMNASMGFNMEKLQPTYKLIMGFPGRSYALTVASQLGMPSEVIEKAMQLRRSISVEWEEALKTLEAQKREMQKMMEEVEHERSNLQQLIQRYNMELEELREEKERILEQARKEATEMLNKVSEEAERILADMRRQTRESVVTERLRRRLHKLKQEIMPKTGDAIQPSELPKVGEKVFVPKAQVYGVVIKVKEETKEVLVEANGIRIWLPASDIQKVAEESTVEKTYLPSGLRLRKFASIPKEINIIGKTVDEALPMVDKFLDDAVLAGHEVVRIIHGKGTGKLRQAIHEFLSKHLHVESFGFAPLNEGGSGTTVVRLKKL